MTCKFLGRFVLDTAEVKQVVRELGVVPLVADWSTPNPEIERTLEKLGGKDIPTLAIFPADRPNEPVVLKGMYTKARLITELKKAANGKEAAS